MQTRPTKIYSISSAQHCSSSGHSHPLLKVPPVKVKCNSINYRERLRNWIKVTFNGASGTARPYLQREVEPLLAVPFIVQTFLKPQGAALLLLVTDHVELLLLVSSHNTEGQLGIFSSVAVLCSELKDLTTRYYVTWARCHLVSIGFLHFGYIGWNARVFLTMAELQTGQIICFVV